MAGWQISKFKEDLIDSQCCLLCLSATILQLKSTVVIIYLIQLYIHNFKINFELKETLRYIFFILNNLWIFCFINKTNIKFYIFFFFIIILGEGTWGKFWSIFWQRANIKKDKKIIWNEKYLNFVKRTAWTCEIKFLLYWTVYIKKLLVLVDKL